MSGSTSLRAADRPRSQLVLGTPVIAMGLATLLFSALMIGDQPFAPHHADKAMLTQEGSVFNRLIILGSLACSLVIGLAYHRRLTAILLHNWLVILFVGWASCSSLWASHPDLVIRRVTALLLVYLTLAGLTAAARSGKDMMVPLAATFALATVLNIIAYLAFPQISWSPIGETGIFDNKNGAGSMAMLAVIILASTLFVIRARLLRVALLGVIALALFFLILTRSKTSIGVTGMVLVMGPIIYVVLGASKRVRLFSTLGGLGLLLACIVALSAAGVDDVALRLMLFGDLTFTGRTEIWTEVVQSIAARPWFGYGFGSFWDTGSPFNPLQSAPLSAWFMDAQLINTAHSGYLDVMVQTGLVGFSIVVLVILRSFWLLTTAAVAARDPRERAALTGALCVVACLVLNNFLESYLFRTGDTFSYLFIFILLQAETAQARLRARRRFAEPEELPRRTRSASLSLPVREFP